MDSWGGSIVLTSKEVLDFLSIQALNLPSIVFPEGDPPQLDPVESFLYVFPSGQQPYWVDLQPPIMGSSTQFSPSHVLLFFLHVSLHFIHHEDEEPRVLHNEHS